MGKDITKYNFKTSNDFQLEVIDLEALTSQKKDYLSKSHRTNFYHVFILENCEPKHVVDFKMVGIPSYSLLFVDKDRVHQFDPATIYRGKVIVFTDAFYCKNETDAAFLRNSILFNDISDLMAFQIADSFGEFLNLCNQIAVELKNPLDNCKPDLLKNYLHNFLLLASREKVRQGFSELKTGKDFDYVLVFRDLLENDYSKLKSVAEYARKMNISEKRLNQATSKIMGKTPKELITDRVLLEAKRQLVHSNLSVKEIGFQLGFDEPTNFIKYFRKHVLKSPAIFRKSFLRN